MGINKSVSRSCLCLRTCLLLLLGGELGGRRDLLFAAGSANVVLEQVKRKQGVSNVCCRRCCYPGQFRECLHQEGKKKEDDADVGRAFLPWPPPGPSLWFFKRSRGLWCLWPCMTLRGLLEGVDACVCLYLPQYGFPVLCPPSNGPIKRASTEARRVLVITASGHL